MHLPAQPKAEKAYLFHYNFIILTQLRYLLLKLEYVSITIGPNKIYIIHPQITIKNCVMFY